MTKINTPLSEAEKQTRPLPGEVDPKDARRMANIFALKEKQRLITATNNLPK